MKSFRTERFHRLYNRLPKHIQREAQEAFHLFMQAPQHPGLQFKRVHPVEPPYSVRINRDYRAVGLLEGDEIVWDFVGAHSQYERYISHFR